ncbi:potassium-transporting ATPase subunit C [Akkermansia sp.]|uniref:potassium-transporting ATPase subunit C n=1 Tax=Akkermansia sp. TaxID=1872421 RepID=UPI003AB1ABB2
MKWTFPNLRLFLALAVITGGIYPAAVTLVSLAVFPHQAHGSLIRNEQGEVIASELIAQPFTSAKYFWPRPSAGDYATMPSGASNLSWTSAELVKTVAEHFISGGILGENVINVMTLNAALDKLPRS